MGAQGEQVSGGVVLVPPSSVADVAYSQRPAVAEVVAALEPALEQTLVSVLPRV